MVGQRLYSVVVDCGAPFVSDQVVLAALGPFEIDILLCETDHTSVEVAKPNDKRKVFKNVTLNVFHHVWLIVLVDLIGCLNFGQIFVSQNFFNIFDFL